MFKICLIGCGFMADEGHGPSCMKYAKAHEDVLLAACCDINLSAAQSFCEKFGFQRAYTDYLEMIEKEDPSVVLVITPAWLTAKVSIDILNRKIPVLLEKPPGMTPEETERIHDAAMQNETSARAAFNRRYMPLALVLKQEIEALSLPVVHVDCMFVRDHRTDSDFSTTAIHGIDTVSYLAGSDYCTCAFDYQQMRSGSDTVVNTQISAVMENGATAALHFLPCGGCVIERMTVVLPDAAMFLELPVWGGMDVPGKLVCVKDGKVYKTVSGEGALLYETNGFYNEDSIFFDALRSGKHPVSDVITGRSSVEISLCMRNKEKDYKKE